VRDKKDGKVAITEVREGGSEVRSVTYGELREVVGTLAKAMRARGVEKGDRVVVVGANSVETAAVMLAAGWVGAIFSSSSTDMGVKGILQRTVQVNPKVREVPFHVSTAGVLLDLGGKLMMMMMMTSVCVTVVVYGRCRAV
jgi:acetoacetyl-CoA synthetase